LNRRLLPFFILLFAGSGVIVAFYFARPYLQDRMQRNTSDSGTTKGTVTVGVDNWVG
jgi:hypothetical protein